MSKNRDLSTDMDNIRVANTANVIQQITALLKEISSMLPMDY
jgi:hypothetical protein